MQNAFFLNEKNCENNFQQKFQFFFYSFFIVHSMNNTSWKSKLFIENEQVVHWECTSCSFNEQLNELPIIPMNNQLFIQWTTIAHCSFRGSCSLNEQGSWTLHWQNTIVTWCGELMVDPSGCALLGGFCSNLLLLESPNWLAASWCCPQRRGWQPSAGELQVGLLQGAYLSNWFKFLTPKYQN